MSMSRRCACVLRPRIATVLLLLTLTSARLSYGQVNVPTQHNDNLRTGANLNEHVLTTANVKSSFGKLFCVPVDGFVYAQPLYMSNLAIAGAGTHNVVFVATAQNSVYAFDADNGALLWKQSMGTPYTKINDPNILAPVGIISTPVIDLATNTIYVLAKTSEDSSGNPCQGSNCLQVFRLHALSVTTGAEKLSGQPAQPPKIAGAVVNASGTQVAFDAKTENQRAALTLANGFVYVAFGSYGDINAPYYGWLFSYSAANLLAPPMVFNIAPNAFESTIWMSGQGPVADAAGNLFLMTGNSCPVASGGKCAVYDQTDPRDPKDYGESFLKLSGNTVSLIDHFTLANQAALNQSDLDLGAGGALELPNTSELVGGGKDGNLYVVGPNSAGALSGLQQFPMSKQTTQWGLWGSPVFWSDATPPTLYVWPVQDSVNAFAFDYASGRFADYASGSFIPASVPAPYAQSNVRINIPNLPFGEDPCGALSLSANLGAAGTGILWASAPIDDPDHATVGGLLYAFDAGNIGTELWDSRQNAVRDDFRYFAKFVPPTIANGKVYVATNTYQICVYGLNPPAPAWHVTDISSTAFAPVSMPVAAGADPSSYILGSQDLIYRGTDSHLHQMWSWGNQAQWFYADLTPLTNAPPLAGKPSGYVIDGNQAIVFRGNDGHIYQVATLGGNGPWNVGASDLSALTTAPAAAGDPIGYVVSGNQYVDYLGTDGHIHQLFTLNNSTQWAHAVDLTLLANAPASAGNPFEYSFGTATQVIVFRGSDNHIHQLTTTDNSAWAHVDISAAAGAPAAAGDASAYVLGNQIVNYRGTDSHIHQIWSATTNGPWMMADLTVLTGATLAAGDPSSYLSQIYTAQLITYTGTDAHIHQLSTYNNNTQWAQADLTSLAGAPDILGNSFGYSFINQQVAYRSSDGHLRVLYLQ